MTGGTESLRLRGWHDRAIVGLALMALCSGFGQFGAVAALGDVAKSFGQVTSGGTPIQQAGLSGTELGVGLAVLRLASLGGLPLSGLADRVGRRITLIASCAFGLTFTVAAAASPGYWWFVVIFAFGRPLLSATNAVAQVGAAEETAARDRAKAVALVAAGYGVGSGLTAVIHGLAKSSLGFRGLFVLAVVPLASVFFIRRWLVEPHRFTVARAAGGHRVPVFGAVGPAFRRRLLVVTALVFAVSVITGPANSFIFVYAQNVLGLSGAVTAAMVVVAGVVGLGGLLAGRWLADHVGRRPTGAASMVAMAVAGVFTYSGSRPALLIGYELGVLAASTFAPAAGTFVNELFPTSVRASVAGWNIAASVLGAVVGLVAFGAIAQVGTHFDGLRAAATTFLPVLVATVLFLRLPETKGREPEDLWPQAG
ncbi:MAG TPA: MFS transporter [Acidimicrobiales bacterium]|nr:MFS transporter [Acidimicrobiales bacterium]